MCSGKNALNGEGQWRTEVIKFVKNLLSGVSEIERGWRWKGVWRA